VEPALENERHLQQGAAFHRLVHQHMLGLAPERLSNMATDKDLSRWWHNYLESAPAALVELRYPEVVLSAPVRGHRLVAKYDLIAIGPGQRAAILDWKTSRKRPRRKWLAARLQTRVYPYLLVRAGAHLNEGRPLQSEQVEMVYWFANFPEDPERFPYDAVQYDADGDYLASLVDEIKNLGENDFPLAAKERRCRYCPYRSLCRRGVKAGSFDEVESEPEEGDDFGIALDFEQIAEIEY
jgi:CRISPR/Cas system-associated exonuclease Cas4 (RecB family)